MASNLLQWVAFQPIPVLILGFYTWEDLSMRNQVVATLLTRTTVNEFVISGNDAANVAFDGHCRYRESEVSLSCEELNRDAITRDLSGLLRPFFQCFLNPKMKKLWMSGWDIFDKCVIWEMLLPYLQESHLRILELRCNEMSDNEAIRLAEGIRCMKSLWKINVEGNRLSFAGMKAIVAAAPASVDHVIISLSEKLFAETCATHECKELLEMAKKRSIYLFTEYERHY
ncbi:hypothetical protein LEN26_017867 [Aphanomyces euteiches]|nr:hypothetical protein LEN26_017867 [Aphanomyces euteiches]KAH9102316.1 hypothetical protein AeMF1_021096 [Aphanomyces euteiches]